MNPGSASPRLPGTGSGAPRPQGSGAPRVIKRYVNRKLYDTVESRYVTLGEIAHAIKAGDEVQVVEERTRRDLTSVILVQIILEEEKRVSRTTPSLLCELIRNDGGQAQHPQAQHPTECTAERTQADLLDRMEAIRTGTEQRLHAVIHRGQLTGVRAKEMVLDAQQAALQLQYEMNERVGAAFEVVAALGKLKREIAYASRRIEDLQERLRGLRGEAGAVGSEEDAGPRELVS